MKLTLGIIMKLVIQNFLILFSLLLAAKTFAAGVLIIGDSLSVPQDIGLGRELEKKLKLDGHKVATVASCGSSPEQFVDTDYKTQCGFYQSSLTKEPISISYFDFKLRKKEPKLTPKLDEIYDNVSKPDLVVIQQGTNLFGQVLANSPAKGAELVTKAVIKLLTKNNEYAPSSKCLWVGPPEIAKMNGQTISDSQKQLMVNAIKEGIRKSGTPCNFLDSRLFTKPPGGDGTHFSSSKQTKAWINETHKQSLSIIEQNEKCLLPNEVLNPEVTTHSNLLEVIQNKIER